MAGELPGISVNDSRRWMTTTSRMCWRTRCWRWSTVSTPAAGRWRPGSCCWPASGPWADCARRRSQPPLGVLDGVMSSRLDTRSDAARGTGDARTVARGRGGDSVAVRRSNKRWWKRTWTRAVPRPRRTWQHDSTRRPGSVYAARQRARRKLLARCPWISEMLGERGSSNGRTA